MVYDTYGVYLKKSIAKSLKVFNKKYLRDYQGVINFVAISSLPHPLLPHFLAKDIQR